MINQYFSEFGNIVDRFEFIIASDIHKRKVNDFLGIIEGTLHFENGILDILEVIRYVDNRLINIKYKYHYRNINNEMIFRYDNAPHHQNVDTFPDHKHTGEKIIKSKKTDIYGVLSEIKSYLAD